MKEVEMYKPLKKYLENEGYLVHSEVEGVDVMAQKGGELLIVEMKLAFNLQLVYQLIERLKMTEQVYAYVPLKKGGRWPKSYKRMCGLLKRLHCGLITLDEQTKKQVVVEFEPSEFKKRKNYTKKNLAVKEFKGRSIDLNQGGSTKEPLFTVYKEKAIRVAMYLFEHGASSTQELKTKLDIENTVSILYNNHLGWFKGVSRGVYQLTPEFEFFRMKHEKKINRLLSFAL
ncbi:MAG: DUF2161 family putative PD-(D/E)XK-type phosphodiesterase [Candidatus Omnitrophota bacterium]|nr:DUF2161 family putative PD-(D/E)XK-type phosphodiesterase [Candidatus Omnitrophota bacterium]